MVNWQEKKAALIVAGMCLAIPAAAIAAENFGGWGAPVNVEALSGSSPDLNSSANDGCPILSPYDDSLYFASNRPGGQGGLDIWVAHRSGDGWGAPVNLGPGINSAADDFCPAPARGNRLFFVSKRTEPNGDIYVAKLGPKGWFQVSRLGDGVNSTAQEWSPSYFEAADGREMLYFSSTRNGNQDIFYSVNFGPAQLAAGGADSSANDARPNVRRDGLEMVWDSDRFGTLGGPDIFTATRSSVDDPWGPAVHLDAPINSSATESRATLSWDGTRMMFGSTRPGGEGSADIYTTTRSKVTGN
jgi:Tol biopolymer transport system component